MAGEPGVPGYPGEPGAQGAQGVAGAAAGAAASGAAAGAAAASAAGAVSATATADSKPGGLPLTESTTAVANQQQHRPTITLTVSEIRPTTITVTVTTIPPNSQQPASTIGTSSELIFTATATGPSVTAEISATLIKPSTSSLIATTELIAFTTDVISPMSAVTAEVKPTSTINRASELSTLRNRYPTIKPSFVTMETAYSTTAYSTAKLPSSSITSIRTFA